MVNIKISNIKRQVFEPTIKSMKSQFKLTIEWIPSATSTADDLYAIEVSNVPKESDLIFVLVEFSKKFSFPISSEDTTPLQAMGMVVKKKLNLSPRRRNNDMDEKRLTSPTGSSAGNTDESEDTSTIVTTATNLTQNTKSIGGHVKSSMSSNAMLDAFAGFDVGGSASMNTDKLQSGETMISAQKKAGHVAFSLYSKDGLQDYCSVNQFVGPSTTTNMMLVNLAKTMKEGHDENFNLFDIVGFEDTKNHCAVSSAREIRQSNSSHFVIKTDGGSKLAMTRSSDLRYLYGRRVITHHSDTDTIHHSASINDSDVEISNLKVDIMRSKAKEAESKAKQADTKAKEADTNAKEADTNALINALKRKIDIATEMLEKATTEEQKQQWQNKLEKTMEQLLRLYD